MKKFLALFLVLAMLLTLVACGGTTSESSKVEESKSSESSVAEESSESSEEGGETTEPGRFDALQETEDHVDLLLLWQALQPTVNEEPTEENPTVRNACRLITATWLEDHPNVTIEWCRNVEFSDEWVTVNYTAGTGPDTFFYYGGAQWVQRGMALVLDEIIESPNYYEPGSPVWKDMFPEYLFDGTETFKWAINDRKEVISIPSLLNPGAATAYYVNKDLQTELGIDHNPTTWQELKENILTAREAGYTGTVVYENGFSYNNGQNWDAQFSLWGAYYAPMIPDVDYDGNGIVDWAEAFYKQWTTGYYYMQNNPAIVEYWEEYMWKIHYGLEPGAFDVDYDQAWTDGKVLYVEEGVWAIKDYLSNPELTFETGMFPPPYPSSADSQYVCDVEKTESGPYKPSIGVTTNIMNPETQGREDYIVDYVVDWMKFVMTNENLSIQVEEQGSYIGATTGCQIPSSLTDWFKNSFPIPSTGFCYFEPGFTEATAPTRTALYEEYMFNMIDQETWIKEYDALLYETIMGYFDASADNAANKEFWAEQYGWDASVFDTDAVKPPHMA